MENDEQQQERTISQLEIAPPGNRMTTAQSPLQGSDLSAEALAREVNAEHQKRVQLKQLSADGMSPQRSYGPSPLDMSKCPRIPQESLNAAVNQIHEQTFLNPDLRIDPHPNNDHPAKSQAGPKTATAAAFNKEKHLVDLKQSSKGSTGNPLLKFQYSANQIFEGASIDNDDDSGHPDRKDQQRKSYIVVNPGVQCETKRTIVADPPAQQYKCVPVTDYRDLITGTKKKNNYQQNKSQTHKQFRNRTQPRLRTGKSVKTPKQNFKSSPGQPSLQSSFIAANIIDLQANAAVERLTGLNPNSVVIYQKAQNSLDKTLHRIQQKNSPSIFGGVFKAAQVDAIKETTLSSVGENSAPTSNSPRAQKSTKRNSIPRSTKGRRRNIKQHTEQDEMHEAMMRPKFDDFTETDEKEPISATIHMGTVKTFDDTLDNLAPVRQTSVIEQYPSPMQCEIFTRENQNLLRHEMYYPEPTRTPQAFVRMQTGQNPTNVMVPMQAMQRTAGGGTSSGLLFNSKMAHNKSAGNVSRGAVKRNRGYVALNNTTSTDPNKFVVVGSRKKQRIEVSYAKLLSIAKGLQQNILPKTHTHLNEIYEQRLKKYLSLKAIHGDDNQTIADKLFNDGRLGDDQLRALQKQVKERQVRALSNENFRQDRQAIIEKQPYYKTHSYLFDSVEELMNRSGNQVAGSVPLTEFTFEEVNGVQRREMVEEDFLLKYNFLGKTRQLEHQVNALMVSNAAQKQKEKLLYLQRKAPSFGEQRADTFHSQKTESHIEVSKNKGHGSPKDGDHEKLLRTYDDLVVDQLIGGGSPIIYTEEEMTPGKDQDGIYKIFCSSLKKANNQDEQHQNPEMECTREEQDLSPATLSHVDRTTNRTPKMRSNTNANNRTETSKSVLSKSFLERNGITAQQNEIAIFDQKRVLSEPTSAHKMIIPNIFTQKKWENLDREQRSPVLVSEMRVTMPMMKDVNTIQPSGTPNETSHSLLNQEAARRALDQKAVRAASLHKTSESVTVASFQQNLSNSVMLKAHWHHGPIANLALQRGSTGYEAENEFMNNSHMGPATRSERGENFSNEKLGDKKGRKAKSVLKGSRYTYLPIKNLSQSPQRRIVVTQPNQDYSGEDREIKSPVVSVKELKNMLETQKTLTTKMFHIPLSGMKEAKKSKRLPFEGNKVKGKGHLNIEKQSKPISPKPYILKATAKLPFPEQKLIEFINPENQTRTFRMPVFILPFQQRNDKTPQDTTLALPDEIQTDYDVRTSNNTYQPVRLSKAYESHLRYSFPATSIQQVVAATVDFIPTMQATLCSQLQTSQPGPIVLKNGDDLNDDSNDKDMQQILPAASTIVAKDIPQPGQSPDKNEIKEVLKKVRASANNSDADPDSSKLANDNGDPMQIKIQVDRDLEQQNLSPTSDGRSLVCLVTKKAKDLSPRYAHDGLKKYQNNSQRTSKDLEAVLDQQKYQTNIQIDNAKLLHHYAVQQHYMPDSPQNMSGQVYTNSQQYLQSVAAGLIATPSHRSDNQLTGEQNRFKFDDGLNHIEKINLLNSIVYLDPIKQKALLMAVLRARINQLSAVENPFKPPQQQVPVKQMTMPQESTIQSQQISKLSPNATPLALPLQIQPPHNVKLSSKKINAQFQQPSFKLSQAMVAGKGSAVQQIKKSPKRSKTRSPDNSYQREIYLLVNKCLYTTEVNYEYVLELLLALERHDAAVELAQKRGTEIVQSTETRNMILTALLNIFMRLQTMEQSNANSGTTLLLQQGAGVANQNIKVDQQDPIVQRLALEQLNNANDINQSQKSRVVLSQHVSQLQAPLPEYRESKNIGTAINLPYFEEEEGYMDEYENMLGVDENIPESKNFSSQKFQSSKNSMHKTSFFQNANTLHKKAVQQETMQRLASQTLEGQKSGDGSVDQRVAATSPVRPSTTKVKGRHAVPINSVINERESAKSLANYNGQNKVNSTLYRNSKRTQEQTLKESEDVDGDENENDPDKQSPQNSKHESAVTTTPQLTQENGKGHQRRVLYQHQKQSSTYSSHNKDESSYQNSTKRTPVVADLKEQNSVLIKNHSKAAVGEFKVSEEESAASSQSDQSDNGRYDAGKNQPDFHTEAMAFSMKEFLLTKDMMYQAKESHPTMQTDIMTELAAAQDPQVQRKYSMQNTSHNYAGKMSIQEPFIGKISFNHGGENSSTPQVIFELEETQQRLYKTQSGPRFRPQIGQFNYQRLNSKPSFTPSQSAVNSDLFAKQKQQRIYQLITKTRPQRQSSHKAGSREFKKLNSGCGSIKSRGYNMNVTPSETQRPYTSGNLANKAGQPGFNDGQMTDRTATFRSNPSSPKRGAGNYAIIQQNIGDGKVASGTISLKDQKALCVVATNPQLQKEDQQKQGSQFYLSQHALSSRNKMQIQSGSSNIEVRTFQQQQKKIPSTQSMENPSQASCGDFSDHTDPLQLKMNQVGGKRVVFSPKFHEKVRDSLATSNSKEYRDPSNYNPVIVPRATRKHKDLGQNFGKSFLARNLQHINEASYTTTTNEVHIFHDGNKNYIQVLDSEQQLNESYRGTRTQTKMMDQNSRANLHQSRQSRFSSTQPQAQAIRLSNPALRMKSGSRSPKFSPVLQDGALKEFPSMHDVELQLQGTQANLKRRYTCSTDNLVRTSHEKIRKKQKTVTQAATSSPYNQNHGQSLADTIIGSQELNNSADENQTDSVDICISPTVYKAGQLKRKAPITTLGTPHAHGQHNVPCATYEQYMNHEQAILVDYCNLQHHHLNQADIMSGSGHSYAPEVPADYDYNHSTQKKSLLHIPPVLIPLQEAALKIKQKQSMTNSQKRGIMSDQSSRSYIPESSIRGPKIANRDLPENSK